MENLHKGIHIMVKPVGAFCNLRCTYCFYLEKMEFYAHSNLQIMKDEILENFIKQYISMNDLSQVQFVWQGGEPMLAGLDFYKRVVELQKKYRADKEIFNSIQTNGTLLDDSWCEFLKKSDFTVGISLDGPKELTNIHRKNTVGTGDFEKIMNGIHLLQKYNIHYTVLACVTKQTVGYPLEIYHFFKSNGIFHIQFTPVVERLPGKTDTTRGLHHAAPSDINSEEMSDAVADWSVPKGEYGDFLIKIYDEWLKKDVGIVCIQNFEWALASWMGLKSTVCIFAANCEGSLVLEHDGYIYSCDHFVYPEYCLGKLEHNNLQDIVQKEQQKDFGCKKALLSPKCKMCEVLFACQGECPRHRFLYTNSDNTSLSYLCGDYKKYFHHIHPGMKAMAQLINNGIPVSRVMTLREHPIFLIRDV